MKNYEDMAKDVLNRIDEYENEMKIKRSKIKKAMISVVPVCAVAIVGAGLWNSDTLTKSNEQFINNTAETFVTYEETTEVPETKAIASKTTEIIVPENHETEKNTVAIISDKADNSEIISDNSVDSSPDDDIFVSADPVIEEEDNTQTAEVENAAHDTTDYRTAEILEEIAVSSTTQVDTTIPEINYRGGDCLGDVTINGVYYLQTTNDNTSYTPDIYLGNGNDFTGYYEGDTSIEFYTAKEKSDIVIVRFYDGTQLNLIKTDSE